MGPGTFEAKFIPLSKIAKINNIYVLRSSPGPEIPKVKYILHPKIFKYKLLKIILLPFYLAILTKRKKTSLILAYHFIPHAFYAYIASLITGRPFIIGQTGLYIQKYAKKHLLSSLINYIIKKSLYINVPGNNSKHFWIKNGIQKEKINLLHSTINTDIYKPKHENIEYDFIILSRLAKVKRLDMLIDVFYNLNNNGLKFKAAIVGNGPCYNNLTQKVKQLKLSDVVFFKGFQNDPVKWFNKSKFYLMNSESEGLPTSLMQAMACELIAVSTSVGNITDLIEDQKNGFLLAHNDINTYEKILETLFVMPNSKYKIIGQKARKVIINNHSYISAINKWEIILQNI